MLTDITLKKTLESLELYKNDDLLALLHDRLQAAEEPTQLRRLLDVVGEGLMNVCCMADRSWVGTELAEVLDHPQMICNRSIGISGLEQINCM